MRSLKIKKRKKIIPETPENRLPRSLPPKTPRKIKPRKVEFKSDEDDGIAPNQIAELQKLHPVKGEKRAQAAQEDEPKKKKQKG